jgi:diaminohydroxyphosphoribosylaminopyrimidine deaminase / 5-amino-6-(5-phosphoribosylamino)uracil reductase
MLPQDSLFMQRALQLASLGCGRVSPNPLVGCVVVYQGRIIGEGWHQKYGEAHAEVNAINEVIRAGFEHLLPQSTVYVTLEPCAHFGKTPPCADLLVAKHVARVVVCNLDPNPLVAGKGLEKLRNAGIAVTTEVLATEGHQLNARFFTFFEKKRPYVILKWAETANGFVALPEGKPLTISNILSRTLSHKWRSQEDAIMVGTNTALNDNPQLNVRLWAGRNPVRVVIDRQRRLPQTLHLFDQTQPMLVFETADVAEILQQLYAQKIQSVLVEGGSKLLQSFINQGLFDEVRVFKSPKKIGAGVAAPVLSQLPQELALPLQDDHLFSFRLADLGL